MFLAVLLIAAAAGAARGFGRRPHRLGAFSASFAAPPMARAPIVSAQAAAPGAFFNVLDFGAQGDGKFDNTGAFTAALGAANASTGGVVFVPAGQFAFQGVLSVPPSVTIMGTYVAPPASNVGQGGPAPSGSVLRVHSGIGDPNGTAFLSLLNNAALTGLIFTYPAQNPTQPPVPFPFTIDLLGEDCAVENVELLNSYQGIRAVNAPRHFISRVYGQPTHLGVLVDQTYDIGRIENVHFNPWYSAHPAYMEHQLTYGEAFSIARSDWEYVLNTFVFGMAVGYHFTSSASGSCNGNFVGIGADMCPNASVLVDAADPWGILVANGEFTSFINSAFGNSSGMHTQVVVSSSNSGAVRFVNSAFWGPSVQIASIAGSGSVGFTSCIFNQWTGGGPAIHAQSGDVLVTGCEFQQSGTQIQLDPGVKRAVVTSNIVTGPLAIVNNGAQDAQIGLNAHS
jgi:hypothetical protein